MSDESSKNTLNEHDNLLKFAMDKVRIVVDIF